MRDNYKTKQLAEVKELMDDEVKFMVEYVNGSEGLINYTNLINTFNYRNEDGATINHCRI